MILRRRPGLGSRMASARSPHRWAACTLAGGLLWGLALPAAAATQWSWNPSIWVGASYNDNLRVTRDPALGPVGSSDTATRAGLALPWFRQTASSSLFFGYRFGITRHQDAKAFDHEDHRVDFNARWDSPRQRGYWGVFVRLWRTQDQFALPDRPVAAPDGATAPPEGGPVSEDLETALTRRLQRDSADLTLRVSRALGRGWSWTGMATAGAVRLASLEAGAGGAPASRTTENRDIAGLGTGWAHTYSARTSLGLQYIFTKTRFEFTPDETLHRANLQFFWNTSRRTTLQLLVGGFQRSRPAGIRLGEPLEAVDDLDYEASLSLRFNEGLTAGPVLFGFSVGIQPSTGEALRDSAVRTGGQVLLSNAYPVAWDWRFRAGYWHRDPTDPNLSSSELKEASLLVERRFNPKLGLQLTSLWVDQSSRDPLLQGDFTRVQLRLVYYLLGGSRLAGR